MNIVILSGSPRNGSISHRVALYLENYLKSNAQHHIDLVSLQKWNLPPIQSAWMSVDKAPAEYRELAEIMFAADAFVLVSPEYNGGYSPAMKNLLDHFPKQTHKPFGIATSSDGVMGGIRASMQLQQLVAALFGILSPVMLISPQVDKKFAEDGTLLDASFESKIHQFVTEFLWLAERLKD